MSNGAPMTRDQRRKIAVIGYLVAMCGLCVLLGVTVGWLFGVFVTLFGMGFAVLKFGAWWR
ncbi:hypothetical protein [Gordonia neofelifaecis]|nr:hypothetical protein [Gordonia neofelifaecis]